jgi:hypothetical protein
MRMICGQLGYKNAAGQPCGQTINSSTRQPCKIHRSEADKLEFAAAGGRASWTAAARQTRKRNKRLFLATPDQRHAAIERAAGALVACPDDPAVRCWADTLVRAVLAAAQALEQDTLDARLRALEGRR